MTGAAHRPLLAFLVRLSIAAAAVFLGAHLAQEVRLIPR